MIGFVYRRENFVGMRKSVAKPRKWGYNNDGVKDKGKV
jgi:hypothetical protein